MNTQGAFHLHSHGDNGCLHAIICQDKLYLQLEAGGVLKLILFFHPHVKCAVFRYVSIDFSNKLKILQTGLIAFRIWKICRQSHDAKMGTDLKGAFITIIESGLCQRRYDHVNLTCT